MISALDFGKLFDFIKKQWVLPVLSTLLLLNNLLLEYVIQSYWYIDFLWYFSDFIVIVAFLGLISILIIGIIELKNKQYKSGLFRIFGGFLGTLMVFSVIFISYQFTSMFILLEDHFADNLKIPQNLNIHKPIQVDYPISAVVENPPKKPDIILFAVGEPGIYIADLFTHTSESGKLYIKAFEVTHDYPLSEKELTKYTSCITKPSSNTNIPSECKTNRFTIYEGDWGVPYAARLEVWIKPDSGVPEKKLIEKNFLIEGWQR